MTVHMRDRGARLGLAALAVPALILVGAGSGTAAENFTNDTLPGKVYLAGGESATVSLTTPEGFRCQDWFVRTVGQKRAEVSVSPMTAPADCAQDGTVSFTVMVDEDYTKKANVVVKFKVYNTDGTAKVVESLVVKANKTAPPQTGTPTAKPTKPAKPGKGARAD